MSSLNILPADISKLIKGMVLDCCYGELLNCQELYVVLEPIPDDETEQGLPLSIAHIWQVLAVHLPKLFDEFTYDAEDEEEINVEAIHHLWSTGIREVDIHLATKLLREHIFPRVTAHVIGHPRFIQWNPSSFDLMALGVSLQGLITFAQDNSWLASEEVNQLVRSSATQWFIELLQSR